MKGYIVAGKNNGGSRTDSVSGAGYIIKVVRLINKSEYLVILLTDGPGHTKLAETRSLTH